MQSLGSWILRLDLFGRAFVGGAPLVLGSILAVDVMAYHEGPSKSDLYKLSLQELLDIKVSTPSRSDETVSTAPATVYVVTEKDILTNGYRTLSEVLENIPGINPIELGFFSFGGVRGFLGNFSQTLILVDGREFQNLIAAETFLSKQFSTKNIKQIEVVNGPSSVLYGANALLGVINIKTKTAAKLSNRFVVDAELGSQRDRGVNIRGHYTVGEWEVSGFARHNRSDNWDYSHFVQDTENFSEGYPDVAQQSHNIDSLGYDNKSVVTNVSVSANYLDFGVGLESYRLKTGKGLENVALNYRDQEDVREFDLIYADWEKSLGKKSHVKVELSHYREKFWGVNYSFNQDVYDGLIVDGRDPEAAFSPDEVEAYFTSVYSQQASSGSKRNKLDLLFDTEFSGGLYLTLGGAYDNQDIRGLALSDVREVPEFDERVSPSNSMRRDFYNSDEFSLYTQLKQEFFEKKLAVTLGARVDDHSNYDTVTTFRGGLVYSFDDSTSLKMLYGEAFREPNIFEQGAQLPPEQSANLELDPAEITTFELGLSKTFSEALNAQLVYFYNTAEDLIEPVNTLLFQNSNEKINTSGVEALLKWVFANVEAEVAYTYISSDGGLVNERRVENLNTPKHRISSALAYKFDEQSSFNVRANWYDSISAEHGNPNVEAIIDIDSALRFDVNYLWRSTLENKNGIAFSLGVKNVFDTEWYQPNVRNGGPKQFLQPGRQLYSNFTYSFY